MGGIQFFIRGLKVLSQPGIRGFVIIPVLLNLVIFAVLTTLFISQFNVLIDWLVLSLGSWLEWILWLLWLMAALLWVVFYGYSFALISNIIASPLYGLLAERVEAHLKGSKQNEPLTLKAIPPLVKRSFIREWQKIGYFAPRFLGLLLLSIPLSFVPLVGLAVPVIYFLWAAWSLTLQNLDYAADNNQVSFSVLRESLSKKRGLMLGFGGITMLASSIPLINLIAIPGAVAGATILWVEKMETPPFQH